MSRSARWVLTVITLQAVLLGVYWVVERQRVREPSAARALGTEPPQRVEMSMPPLILARRDGSTARMSPPERPTLVHVWATWCPACRAELPALLALPTERAVDVVAIALDEERADVERFLDGQAAPHVFLGDGAQVERALGVRSLPVTFLLTPGERRFALRFDGARDWANQSFVERWLGRVEGPR
jgi:thiol-disulfide isomerase/thioredoxin